MAKPIVKQNIETINTNVGNLTSLTTQDKTSLVNAVNENVGKITVLSTDRGYITPKNISNGNLDSITENGKYFGNQLDGLPIGLSKTLTCVIDVSKNTDSWHTIQTLSCDSGSYMRWKSGTWQPWKQLATTEKVEIALPFNSGYEHGNVAYTSKIKKTSLGLCILDCTVKKTDGSNFTVGQSVQISTLPTGFVAKHNISNVGLVATTTGGAVGSCGTYIVSNGVYINPTVVGNCIQFQLTYEVV